MSLLMDALKKAEEEKKKAAKQLEEVEASAHAEIDKESGLSSDEQTEANENKLTNTMKLSLEPLDSQLEETISESSSEEKLISEKEVPTEDASGSFSEDLTLENTIAEESLDEVQKEIDLNDTTIIEGLSTENASAPFDDTFHGVILDNEEQGSEVYEETLPGVPADQLVKDIGGGVFQPTPVAAKTVFNAGRVKSKKSPFSWGVFVVLIFLAVGSFAVFYYFSTTPVARNLPSPNVARGIESSVTPITELPEMQTPDRDVVSGTIIEPDNIENEFVEQSVIEQKMKEVIEEVDKIEGGVSDNAIVQDTEKESSTETTVETKPSVEREEKIAEVEIQDSKMSEISAQTNVSQPESEKVLPDTDRESFALTENNFKQISISKAQRAKEKDVIVKEAYKAYLAADYDAARSLYISALKQDGDNRDAHLGLAAIALHEQDRATAYSHYAKLLKLNPDDSLVISALVNLYTGTDPIKDESAIKLLLRKEGELPYLYFTLGNIYARQSRWPEAQQAFFDAYRLDTTNADYVLNLAVSLDHVGQYAAAYDYYKTASELGSRTSASFDYVAVNNRISSLEKLLN